MADMKVLVFNCRKVLEINCRKLLDFTCFLHGNIKGEYKLGKLEKNSDIRSRERGLNGWLIERGWHNLYIIRKRTSSPFFSALICAVLIM